MIEIVQTKFDGLRVSSLIRTKAIGIEDQADFVNGALYLETELTQEELRQYLKRLEDQLGRDRTAAKFGPRTMDLDIVVWNETIVDDDYFTRDFIRNSVAEIGYPTNK